MKLVSRVLSIFPFGGFKENVFGRCWSHPLGQSTPFAKVLCRWHLKRATLRVATDRVSSPQHGGKTCGRRRKLAQEGPCEVSRLSWANSCQIVGRTCSFGKGEDVIVHHFVEACNRWPLVLDDKCHGLRKTIKKTRLPSLQPTTRELHGNNLGKCWNYCLQSHPKSFHPSSRSDSCCLSSLASLLGLPAWCLPGFVLCGFEPADHWEDSANESISRNPAVRVASYGVVNTQSRCMKLKGVGRCEGPCFSVFCVFSYVLCFFVIYCIPLVWYLLSS